MYRAKSNGIRRRQKEEEEEEMQWTLKREHVNRTNRGTEIAQDRIRKRAKEIHMVERKREREKVGERNTSGGRSRKKIVGSLGGSATNCCRSRLRAMRYSC